MTWEISESGPRASVRSAVVTECDGFIGQVLMKSSQKAAILAAIDGTPGDNLIVEACGTLGSMSLLDVHSVGGGPGDGGEGP